MIKIDGFVIELNIYADEQLMVSREEPYKPPDYRYSQSSTFENIDFIFCLTAGALAVSSACRSLLKQQKQCHISTKHTTFR